MTQKLFRNSFDTTSYVDGWSCKRGRLKLVVKYWYNCSSYLLCDWFLCSDRTDACRSGYCKGKYVVQITTFWKLFLRKVIATNQHFFISRVTNFVGTNFLPSTHFHGVQFFYTPLHTSETFGALQCKSHLDKFLAWSLSARMGIVAPLLTVGQSGGIGADTRRAHGGSRGLDPALLLETCSGTAPGLFWHFPTVSWAPRTVNNLWYFP